MNGFLFDSKLNDEYITTLKCENDYIRTTSESEVMGCLEYVSRAGAACDKHVTYTNQSFYMRCKIQLYRYIIMMMLMS